MPSNPLVILVLGLFCVLAPALFVHEVQPGSGDDQTGPSRISTANAEKQACRDASVRVAGGGRFGCVEERDTSAPKRRVDKTGALFVSVGK
ncbi:MAG: hypothetical protein AAFP28_11950 [Pseudomonadota bacterium]